MKVFFLHLDSYINKYFFFVFPAFCIASDGPIKARSTANKGKIASLGSTVYKVVQIWQIVLKRGSSRRLVGTGAGVLYNMFIEWISWLNF